MTIMLHTFFQINEIDNGLHLHDLAKFISANGILNAGNRNWERQTMKNISNCIYRIAG